MRLSVLILASSVTLAMPALLTGCAQSQQNAAGTANSGSTGQGILGSLRPKVDPAVVQRIKAEEQAQLAQQQQQQNQAAAQMPDSSGSNFDTSSRVLPRVSTDPIAPPAEEAEQQQLQQQQNGAIFSPAVSGMPQQFPNGSGMPGQSPTYVASYAPDSNVPPPPPGGKAGGGLIPPPPAVTLSTQAQVGAPGALPVDPNAAFYGNPYMMNPYAIPYPQMQMPPQAMPQMPTRPSGSPFAAPTKAGPDADPALEEKAKKNANFVPITPTGMEARSAYKQRDDLKALWNGVLKSNSMSILMKDEKFNNELVHVEIGLPGESTKGSFAVSPRQVDTIFKNASLDKRIFQPVKKLQTEMVQAYYRYIYSYNKFALAQQTVMARKQEVDVADTASEKQRAAADLSAAQNEAESAKDDMRAAQSELSSISGPQATRYIIGKVTGITPTAESLGQPETASAPTPDEQKSNGGGGGGPLGMLGSVFGFGGHKQAAAAPPEDAKPAAEAPKVAKQDKPADKKEKSGKDKDKNSKDKKGKAPEKIAAAAPQKGDLKPAPEPVADEPAAGPPSDISFELKNVNVTPRKSVLNVSIKNTGANNFSFSPEVFSISDGNHKISEASVRADFDQTLVPPNQEVKGTITIFGRPWNERLAVVLSDGGKNIQMRR